MELWHHVHSCTSQHHQAELGSVIEISEDYIQSNDALADSACELVRVWGDELRAAIFNTAVD